MGSNCSFGSCYNNATINFFAMKVLSLFLLVLQRPLKHQNLILHKFYLVELSCKLYNPFFRVVFHNPDNIIWCNFLVRTLQHCPCMGKRPGKMRNDAFYESLISLCFLLLYMLLQFSAGSNPIVGTVFSFSFCMLTTTLLYTRLYKS